MPGGGRGTVVIIGMRDKPVAAEAGVTLQQPEAHRVFSFSHRTDSWSLPLKRSEVLYINS